MDPAIDIDTFSPFLYQHFAIHFHEQSAQAELIEAASIRQQGLEAAARTPFVLVFRTSDEPAHEQGNYRVTHSSLGELVMFLVPIGPDQHGMRYEAVFS